METPMPRPGSMCRCEHIVSLYAHNARSSDTLFVGHGVTSNERALHRNTFWYATLCFPQTIGENIV